MHYTSADAKFVIEHGKPMVKRPNPVWMAVMDHEFTVDTNEGLMSGHAGGYLAYDPLSGHVWPVSAEYVGQHYDPLEES